MKSKVETIEKNGGFPGKELLSKIRDIEMEIKKLNGFEKNDIRFLIRGLWF